MGATNTKNKIYNIMAKRIIQLDICVSDIDKGRLNKGKNGKFYLKATAIETPNGKYGDWLIVESRSKEESEAGNKGTILGNGKNFGWGGTSTTSQSDNAFDGAMPMSSDDIPF